MSKWYGSLNNRVEENRMFCDSIEVGTGVTEYLWSDRHPYEVTQVIDQKHVYIREMGHKKVGDRPWYSNDWELFSDESKPEIKVVKRGQYWYTESIITPEEAKKILEGNDIDLKIWASQNGFDLPTIVESGKVKKAYHRKNISFGVAKYYYDYEF